jgi:hypothetical protein
MVSLGARTGDKSDSQERLNSLADTIKKLHSHPAESSEFQEGRENALTALKALRDHAMLGIDLIWSVPSSGVSQKPCPGRKCF